MILDIRTALKGKVPSAALDYCVDLWQEAPFQLKLSRARSSKLGDYRFDSRNETHRVTVNQDLNPYQFLITYVHEVAHMRAHQPKRRLKPHGQHWKHEFRRLLLPVMTDLVFPGDVLRPLAKHMKNPKASTAGDPVLLTAIAKYDVNPAGLRLMDLMLDDEFLLRDRAFRLLEKKRTRALCLDLGNNKKYLIPMVAEVKRAG